MPAMNPAVFDSLRMYGIAFQFMHNTLLYNQGKGYYSEIAHMCNLDNGMVMGAIDRRFK